jgi:hypothetical protein
MEESSRIEVVCKCCQGQSLLESRKHSWKPVGSKTRQSDSSQQTCREGLCTPLWSLISLINCGSWYTTHLRHWGHIDTNKCALADKIVRVWIGNLVDRWKNMDTIHLYDIVGNSTTTNFGHNLMSVRPSPSSWIVVTSCHDPMSTAPVVECRWASTQKFRQTMIETSTSWVSVTSPEAMEKLSHDVGWHSIHIPTKEVKYPHSSHCSKFVSVMSLHLSLSQYKQSSKPEA